MAEINTTKDLVINDEHVTLSMKRHGVALESTFEIGKLVDVLRKSVPLDDNETFYLVRGLTARIEQLNNVILAALDDDAEQTSDLAYRLRLEYEEVAA